MILRTPVHQMEERNARMLLMELRVYAYASKMKLTWGESRMMVMGTSMRVVDETTSTLNSKVTHPPIKSANEPTHP